MSDSPIYDQLAAEQDRGEQGDLRSVIVVACLVLAVLVAGFALMGWAA